MRESPRIGIDLDNTIIDYDAVLRSSAKRLGLMIDAAGTKSEIRAVVRALPDGERHWTRLQAHVYGRAIDAAVKFPGVDAFFTACAQRGVPIWIISHKTLYAAGDPSVDLRAAATHWLERAGLLAASGPLSGVFYESTRAAKVNRIAALGCTLFIDDLPEVFAEPHFPRATRGVLFGASGGGTQHPLPCADWAAVRRAVFCDAR